MSNLQPIIIEITTTILIYRSCLGPILFGSSLLLILIRSKESESWIPGRDQEGPLHVVKKIPTPLFLCSVINQSRGLKKHGDSTTSFSVSSTVYLTDTYCTEEPSIFFLVFNSDLRCRIYRDTIHSWYREKELIS